MILLTIISIIYVFSQILWKTMSLGTGLLKCSNLIGIIQRFVIWSISNKPKVLEALTWKAFNLGKSLPSLLLYQCNHLLKIVSKEFQLSFIFMYLRNNESLYKKTTYSWARITCIISCNQIHENDENIWMSNLRSKSLTWKASTNLTHLNDIGVTEFICLSSKSVDHLYSLLFRISFQLSDLVIPWCDCISCILQPSLNTISTNPWLCWTKFPKILLA